MNTMFAGIIGGWELILILAVVLILFGSKKLPELAKGLGQGIREFKKASREVTDEFERASDEHQPAYRPPPKQVQEASAPVATPPPSSTVPKA